MTNFTLSEPPVPSGKSEEDLKLIFAWLSELYNNLWAAEFIAAQQRKSERGGG